MNSVLTQSVNDIEWEIIVIDNTPLENGTTYAYNLVKQIKNDKISYIHNEVNIGSGYNWNRGVIHAKGKWIVFLHDDDIMNENALLSLKKIVDSKRRFIKNMGYLANSYWVYNGNKSYCIKLTQIGTLLHGYTRTNTPSCGTCILREAYIETGGVNYDFGPTADAILGYIMMKKYGVYLYSMPLGEHRNVDNITNNSHVLEQLIDADELFAKYRYEKTILAKIWGLFFSTTISKKNLKEKQQINNKLINKANFGNCYYSYYGVPDNKVMFMAYKLLLTLYDSINILVGMIRARI